MTKQLDGKLDSFTNFIFDHFMPILIASIVIGFTAVYLIWMLPIQESSDSKYNKEQAWLPNASCAELKQYVIESLNNNPQHYFEAHAKELYDWKCSR